MRVCKSLHISAYLYLYIHIYISYIYRKREREGQIGRKRERERQIDTARAKSRKNVNKAEQPEQGVGTDVQRVFEVVELCRPGFLDHRTLVHRVNAPKHKF